MSLILWATLLVAIHMIYTGKKTEDRNMMKWGWIVLVPVILMLAIRTLVIG